QIWIEPDEEDVKPSYQQIAFAPEEKKGRLRLLVGPNRDISGATTIHQDARLYVTELAPKQTVSHELVPGRHAWIQVVRGDVSLNGEELHEGDARALSEETKL